MVSPYLEKRVREYDEALGDVMRARRRLTRVALVKSARRAARSHSADNDNDFRLFDKTG